MLPRLNLRGTLLLGTLIPLVVVTLVAGVVLQAFTDSLQNSDAAIRSEQSLFAANLVTQDVIDAETGVRGYVIAQQAAFLGPYQRGIDAFPADIAALRSLQTDDSAQLTLIGDVDATFAEWRIQVAEPVIAAVAAHRPADATNIIVTGQGKERIDRIRTDLSLLSVAERDQSTARLAAARDSTVVARRVAFYGTVGAILLAVFLAIIFTRRVSGRISSVSEGATKVAAGDFTERVPVTGHDEVTNLAIAFNAMAGQLETSDAAERQAMGDLKRRTTEAEGANRELEAFSYSVSHDLRAPLRAIDGFSLALAEDYGPSLDATAADYIGRVRAATQRMGALIDDLLRLSRITRDTMTSEPVDLSGLAGDVVAELRAAAPSRSVAVTIQPDMSVVGDPRLLRVALDNLLGNAWKFTTGRADATIDVHEERTADGVEYVVADNGAGFDMRFADKLFGPFQRLHTADAFEGTGIGLATAQRIIHRHGGVIRASAEVDHGARFAFTLPRELVSTAKPAAAPQPASPETAGSAPLGS